MPAPRSSKAQSTQPEEFMRWMDQLQRSEAVKTYTDTIEMADAASIAQVKSLTEQIEKSFNTAQSVHKISLVVLLLIFVISCMLALWPGVGDFQRMVGVIGMPVILIMLLVLVYRSPLHSARKSMADVVKIQTIYLSYLRRINQLDMGFKQSYLSTEEFSSGLFEKTSEKMQEIIDKALDDINLLMEDLD